MFDLLNVEFPTSGVDTYIFIPFLVALAISFFTSIGGVSGAFLILPFQISVLDFTTPSVSATTFLYNVVGTPGGVYRYVREGRLAWPVALILIAGLIPGILLGYYLRITYLPDPRTFKLFVGIVLMYVAVRLLRNVWTQKQQVNDGAGRIESISLGLNTTRFDFKDTSFSFSTAGMLTLAFAVGIISGIYGIGGGAIIAPFCLIFFKLPVHAIAGAVLLGSFVSSGAGVAFYSMVPINGVVAPPDWALGILFGLGGLLGMYFGAKVQKYIPERWIKLLLGSIVITVAIRYILQFVVNWSLEFHAFVCFSFAAPRIWG